MNIPGYINDKRNIVRLVSFTAIFALVFINIYKPFSSLVWYPVSEFMFFVYSSLVILTGVLVVIISRIIMYLYSRRHPVSYWKYSIWVLSEITFMSLFYTIYTLSISRDKDTMEVFQSSFINTALVLLLPYTVLWFYFGWKESSSKLEIIEKEGIPDEISPRNITLKDEKGVLRLSVNSSDLLYIESSDNYVVIYYSNKGKIKKYLLRNTLKSIERDLTGGRVVRCHRSTLVNLERVKVIRRDREGLFLEMDIDGVPDLSVSASYQKIIGEKFI
ncbi:MAG: LytTR family DNA-binding domain-containing protein [Bacteroidales bacterium]|jgi:hypothetical protein|nr:LytTR family DNA-binding domain-containing protein [Bacteroidales bacterium]